MQAAGFFRRKQSDCSPVRRSPNGKSGADSDSTSGTRPRVRWEARTATDTRALPARYSGSTPAPAVHGFPVECRMPDTGRQQTAFDLSANQDMGGRKAGLSLRFVLIDHFSPDEFPDFFAASPAAVSCNNDSPHVSSALPKHYHPCSDHYRPGTHGSRNIPNPATGPADKQQPEAFLPYDTDQ